MTKQPVAKLQVLMSVMNQADHSILKASNIQTPAIIINQCYKNKVERFKYKNNPIEFVSTDLRGVGSSRNHALMRANSEFCLFADEDIEYEDGYEALILQEFAKRPHADMILFNVPSKNPNRPQYMIKSLRRVRRYNSLRYGAVRIAVRTESIRSRSIYFSLLFGGGAKYSSGEDSLFIYDCLRRGMIVYCSPTIIGKVAQESSTWFSGYNNKYFEDKGAFFYTLSPRLVYIFAAQFVIRGRGHRSNMSKQKIIRLIMKGVKTARYEV